MPRRRLSPEPAASVTPAAYRALVAIPGTHVEAGDTVVIDPRAPSLFGPVQWLTTAPIFAAIQAGLIRPLQHEVPLVELARLAGITLPSPIDADAFLRAVQGPGKPPVRERRHRKRRPPKGGPRDRGTA